MKQFHYAIVILLALILTNCRSIYTWKPKGPFNKSGPVKQIIVDKNNSNKLFAATENGGVWVNEDYTTDHNIWSPITDQLENLQTRGFDVSERFPNKMIVGNGLGNLHISYNSGENWNRLGNFNYKYIRKIAIDDVLGTILILNVASQKGLYKIEVRGEGENPLILMDTITNAEVLDFVIDKYSKNVRYYSARKEGVYKSINYGNTWRKVLSVETSNTNMIKIAQPSENGITIIKVGRQLFSNHNSRNRFDSINRPPDNSQTTSNSDVGYRNRFGGKRGDWNHAVAISPKNSDEMVFGTFRPFYTNDKGANWTGVGYGHEDLHHIVYVNDDVLTATDGGVIKLTRHSNGQLVSGSQYLNQGLNTYQFYRVAINGNTAVGNADHNGIKFTENLNSENPNWRDVYYSGYGNNGLENDFVYKDVKNPDRYFVQFQAMNLLRLNIPYDDQNSGNDLFVFHNPSTFLNPYMRIQGPALNQQYNNLNYPLGTMAQDPRTRSNTMLIASHDSNSGTVSYSNNFSIKMSRNANVNPTGMDVDNCDDNNSRTFCYDPVEIANETFPTWTESYNNGNIPIVSIAYSSNSNGKAYALDESGKFLMNTNVDNNDKWQEKGNINLNTSETMRQLIVNKNNTSRLFAISHQRIFKSTNEGETWRALGFSLPVTNKINGITQHHKTFETYFVATDKGIFFTKNSGDSWAKFGEKLPNAPIMQIFAEGKYLYAASFGRGLWRCDLENPKKVFLAPGN